VFFRWVGKQLYLDCRVQPKSNESSIAGVIGDNLKIRLTATLKEPLCKYMTTLAYSQCRYQGALAQECVDLSSQCNAESGIGCRPLRAGSVAPRRFVVALAKDDAITCARRLTAERDRLPQSGHILAQRLLCDGKANKQLIRFLSKQFQVKQSAITIVSGHTSRLKRLCIDHPNSIPESLKIIQVS
jgi:uncharacterized protein YggU (UPF0235/DUF167 family)